MAMNELHHAYAWYQKRGDSRFVRDQWKDILEGGHDPNEVWGDWSDPRRSAPLFAALLDEGLQDLQLVDLLVDHGVRLEEHNRDGRTALQEAVLQADQPMILFLLDRGAKLETPMLSDFLQGGTVLHLAVLEGVVDVVRTLLDRGSDPQARTQIGWSPMDIAVLDHHTTILDILLAKVGSTPAAIRTETPAVSAVGTVEDEEDESAISCHLIENGVRDTERKHVVFFQTTLSRAIQDLTISHFGSTDLSTLIIRDMDSLLLSDAGLDGTFAWPRGLCETCNGFEKQDSHGLAKIYEHQQSFSDLMVSSKNGCNLCQYFVECLKGYWCLLHQIDKRWLKEFGLSPKVRLKVGWNEGRGRVQAVPQMIITCSDKIAFIDLHHIQKHINLAVAQTSPSDTETSGSDRSLAVAKAWLRRCEDEHPSCQRHELGRLPKRVIDVGNEASQPRIYVSARERVPYAALSYCWGGHQGTCLLTTNIDEYAECLPLVSLPQTIAHAVIVARELDIRYLWVDSFCILQDSMADLSEELAYMGDIYAQAWLTIAATDSTNSGIGLFHQREWPISAITPTEIRMPSRTIQREGEIYGRMKNTRTSCLNRLVALAYHNKPRDTRQKPVLHTRGWALQEDVLSRRVLSFGRHELSWTCLEGSCSELSPAEQDVRTRNKWYNIVKRLLVTGFAGYGNMNHPKDKEVVLNYWFEGVEDFLKRNLSMPRDKIAAISGVQAAIGKIVEDDMVAGVWGGAFFAHSILWLVENERDDGMHSSFPCPSWSWASTSRPVKYIKHPTSTDNSRPWVWHHEVKYFPVVVSRDIDDRGLDGITGYVTVRCKLLKEADMDCEKHHAKDFLNAPPRSQSGREAIHFERHHDFEAAESISDSWLMLVRTVQFIPGSKDRGYKYDIGTCLLRLEKLSSDQADFRRVGVVMIRSWANKWLAKASDETIRLF